MLQGRHGVYWEGGRGGGCWGPETGRGEGDRGGSVCKFDAIGKRGKRSNSRVDTAVLLFVVDNNIRECNIAHVVHQRLWFEDDS